MSETITINNNSEDVVRIAIFQRNYLNPNLTLVPWRIRSIPVGGSSIVPVPASYGVHVNYGDRTDPDGGTRSASLLIGGFEAVIDVNSASTQDQSEVVPVLQPTSSGVVQNEIHLVSHLPYGCWAHITKDGDDIFPAQVLVPGQTLVADARPTYFVAVISEFVNLRTRLRDVELSSEAFPILTGQTVSVTGSMWHGGYEFEMA